MGAINLHVKKLQKICLFNLPVFIFLNIKINLPLLDPGGFMLGSCPTLSLRKLSRIFRSSFMSAIATLDEVLQRDNNSNLCAAKLRKGSNLPYCLKRRPITLIPLLPEVIMKKKYLDALEINVFFDFKLNPIITVSYIITGSSCSMIVITYVHLFN